MIEIVKNKRKNICKICGKKIIGKHKIRWGEDSHYIFYHLSCGKERIENNIKVFKSQLKKYTKLRAKLKRLNKEMVLEQL